MFEERPRNRALTSLTCSWIGTTSGSATIVIAEEGKGRKEETDGRKEFHEEEGDVKMFEFRDVFED